MCNSSELQHLSNLICQTRSICLVASRSPQVNGRTKLKFWCNCTSHVSLQKENSSPSHGVYCILLLIVYFLNPSSWSVVDKKYINYNLTKMLIQFLQNVDLIKTNCLFTFKYQLIAFEHSSHGRLAGYKRSHNLDTIS